MKNNWPSLHDRNWPKDIPDDYFELNASSPRWAAISSMLIGLSRRVDELERKNTELQNRVSSDSMAAAMSADYWNRYR